MVIDTIKNSTDIVMINSSLIVILYRDTAVISNAIGSNTVNANVDAADFVLTSREAVMTTVVTRIVRDHDERVHAKRYVVVGNSMFNCTASFKR